MTETEPNLTEAEIGPLFAPLLRCASHKASWSSPERPLGLHAGSSAVISGTEAFASFEALICSAGDRTVLSSMKRKVVEFSGDPVVRTWHFRCWGPRFEPWLGNLEPTGCILVQSLSPV